MHGLKSLCERRASFCMALISRKLCRFLFMFSTGFISLSVLLLFPLSIYHLLRLCAQFFILFHLTQMRFSQSSHLSLETLMLITRTGVPILVELIDLVNCYNFLSQMTLLRWLTFLLGSQTVILTVQLLWIYFFPLMLVFILQWFSLHWEILIMLSQFPLPFYQIFNGVPPFIAQLMAILVLIGMVFVIISEMFHGSISLNLVLLLLLVNFVSGFRLELMYMYLIKNIRSSLIHLHGFQPLVRLPQFIEITFFVCNKRITLLTLK